jgi:hypothetical protein
VTRAERKRLFDARDSAFTAGLGALLVPYVLMAVVGSQLGLDVFNAEAFEEAPRWLAGLCLGIFATGWQGMRWLAVKRHDPRRKKE